MDAPDCDAPIADEAELRRLEEVALNSSATPRQLLYDGWLVRLSPGKAKRARSINPFYPSTRPLDEKLARCAEMYAAHGLPLLVRVTPFVHPPDLDAALEARGFTRFEPTRVMTRPLGVAAAGPPAASARVERASAQVGTHAIAPARADAGPHPVEHARGDAGAHPVERAHGEVSAHAVERVEVPALVDAVSALRGASDVDRAAHLQRLDALPLERIGFVIRDASGAVCAGLVVIERPYAGIFDVVTSPAHRGRGHASALTAAMLDAAAAAGATIAYLQVDATNEPARAVYRRHGFVDRYTYWYRRAPGA